MQKCECCLLYTRQLQSIFRNVKRAAQYGLFQIEDFRRNSHPFLRFKPENSIYESSDSLAGNCWQKNVLLTRQSLSFAALWPDLIGHKFKFLKACCRRLAINYAAKALSHNEHATPIASVKELEQISEIKKEKAVVIGDQEYPKAENRLWN